MLKKLGLGLLMGVAGPLLVLWIIFIVKYRQYTFYDFMENAYQFRLMSIFLSLAVIINLATFWLFINSNKILIARGIIVATFLIGAVILLLRFNLI